MRLKFNCSKNVLKDQVLYLLTSTDNLGMFTLSFKRPIRPELSARILPIYNTAKDHSVKAEITNIETFLRAIITFLNDSISIGFQNFVWSRTVSKQHLHFGNVGGILELFILRRFLK